jgi:uncharacterized peroxidase-related enzyme
MAFIETIEPKDSKGKLQSIYGDLEKSRGSVAEVLKLHSLNPESMQNHVDLYMTLMFKKSPLKRYQREMIAVVVSLTNNCDYCQIHHSEALQNFWKDEKRIEKFNQNFLDAGLSDKDLALCIYSQNLTQNPQRRESEIIKLRDQNFSDTAILDTTMIISYFNFVNRMVIGLGAELEVEAGKGFLYD